MRAALLIASVLLLACGPQRPRVDAEAIEVEAGPLDGPAAPATIPDARLLADLPADHAEQRPDAALAPDAPGPEPPRPAAPASPASAAGGCPFAFCSDFEGVPPAIPPDPRVWSR